jgi:capsular polysaccharide biosynthesis protein
MRPLVWSSSKGLATGPESGDAESGSDASAVQEKEHVSLVLHADGNLLLSRQFPRLKRREVIWETASGGEFSKYLLELLIDLEGPYFQVSDIAENPEEKPRIIYTSRLGDVSLRRIDKESDLQDATTRPGLR